MPLARIYSPAKSAMQSGENPHWRLEFVPETPYFVDPLMGWSGMQDTTRQIALTFEDMQQAVDYATRHHITYELEHPAPEAQKSKAYAENFSFNRVPR